MDENAAKNDELAHLLCEIIPRQKTDFADDLSQFLSGVENTTVSSKSIGFPMIDRTLLLLKKGDDTTIQIEAEIGWDPIRIVITAIHFPSGRIQLPRTRLEQNDIEAMRLAGWLGTRKHQKG